MLTMNEIEWIRCPVCGNKTRNKIRADTVLKKYPLYSPKCKQETLIEVSTLEIAVIKEPDALDAEPLRSFFCLFYRNTPQGCLHIQHPIILCEFHNFLYDIFIFK